MKKFCIIFISLLVVTLCITLVPNGKTVKAEKYNGQVITVYKSGDDIPADYQPANRQWQAIATIESTGKRLWASWMAGGTTEPDPKNHIILAYSDDNGETWVDPYIVIDDENTTSTRMRDPVLWACPTGDLWLFYGYSGGSGTYLITLSNPEGSIDGITVSSPRNVFSETILNKPCVTSWGEWLVNVDPYIEAKNFKEGHILSSTDQGKTWSKKADVLSTISGKKWHEATIIEKNDGSLWSISRIEQGKSGGLEQAFSTDKGKTWSTYQSELSAPFRGPGSKCSMYKLKSGHILFVNNDSTSSRVNMTAYISCDDGKTWKYLVLDSRIGCAYPDICQDDSGMIYVIWDFGRCVQNEIRISRFTEADVLSSAFYTENAKNRICVAKDDDYHDIVKVNTQYTKQFVYNQGDSVTKEEIISTLPTTLNVEIDNGETLNIEGEWKLNYLSTKNGAVYTIKFSYNTRLVPSNVSDNLGLMTATVVIKGKEVPASNTSSGCFASVDLSLMPTMIIIVVAVLLFTLKKVRNNVR